ncbi:hypothetical protein Tco_1119677 [Tanacetum coccineum]
MIRRVESCKDQESLGVPKDASKQGRSIEDIDADVDVSLVDEAQEKQNDDLMFDSRVLEDDKSLLAQTLYTDKAAKPKVITTTLLAADKQQQQQDPMKEAMMEANRLMAERLQSKEREELIDEEKAKLFMELIKKRRKHFAALRAQEKRNRPPTKEQNRTQMSTYLKHMGKQRKVEEEKESEEVEKDDEVELKKLLLHKEGMLVHYELIRADGSSKRYSSMIKMIQGIDREDLEALWRIVKAKYGNTMPKDDFERVLYGDLRVMFEPDIKSNVWRML